MPALAPELVGLSRRVLSMPTPLIPLPTNHTFSIFSHGIRTWNRLTGPCFTRMHRAWLGKSYPVIWVVLKNDSSTCKRREPTGFKWVTQSIQEPEVMHSSFRQSLNRTFSSLIWERKSTSRPTPMDRAILKWRQLAMCLSGHRSSLGDSFLSWLASIVPFNQLKCV